MSCGTPQSDDCKPIEEKALATVAELMCLAARTAPKARGVDNLVTTIISGETKDKVTAKMRDLSSVEGAGFFARDADNVDGVPFAVVIGTRMERMGLSICGLCGFENCKANQDAGAVCVFPPNDLGIAVGSAVSVAADHRVDNRVMYTIGMAALKLGLLGEEVKMAFGIPLSATGKSPFFDR
ncbi:MAG: ferredoxin [Armatimonadetes bacterium CG2_30_59_28]|nr:ferredoxin [Armatimonadota bacterium]OIO90965.1 MAG: ferredoxin [Armatimonadetes bacterium CG2_30_59_28]PIU67168.1 MAG: ferredoxin [Armatimonadetes bacterium CG07_land_8_20_14_0_80_59_28]PIX38870.1 MAG: ferredoxin [Armatimonadetes bacterium CG_4_8_14_3_um_filter_58_9]PIY38570.1 MAG: ferredoxin [Armatimonadetes bacterium CG_4_10_14_3_um_filter_59_10]PJB71275.1 MAG: ferredoxin [Armatimonadetes bacterium CG_4_9_14_3_um_filter_58_7]